MGMHLKTPSFKIISDNDIENIPVSIASKIMMDVQSLILHIGAQLIEKDLMLIYNIEKPYLDRFILHVTAVDGKSMTLSTSASDKFSGSIMDDAIKIMITLMDKSEDDELMMILSKTFPNPEYRSWITGDLDTLSRDLEKYHIQYDSIGASGVFKGASEKMISKWSYPLPNEHFGEVMGILYKDPLGRPRLACDKCDVDLIFEGKYKKQDALTLCGNDICAISGDLSYSRIGILNEIHMICNITKIYQVSFSKIISETRDVSLSTPIEANISYDIKKKTWSFSNDDMNIHITETSWDDAVKRFHSSFMDCLEGYNGNPDDCAMYAHIKKLGPSFHK